MGVKGEYLLITFAFMNKKPKKFLLGLLVLLPIAVVIIDFLPSKDRRPAATDSVKAATRFYALKSSRKYKPTSLSRGAVKQVEVKGRSTPKWTITVDPPTRKVKSSISGSSSTGVKSG